VVSIKKIIAYFAVGTIFAMTSFVLYRYIDGDRTLSVQTNSMVPTFSAGDAVITQKVTLQNLRVGDVISYKSPADNKVIVSHRLIDIDYQTGKLVTKGDALELRDFSIPSRLVRGRVYLVMPGIGSFLDWLHKPTGLIVAVYIPAALVLMHELRRYIRSNEDILYKHTP
jgi:signal peptidase I